MLVVGDKVKVKYIQNPVVLNYEGKQFDITTLVNQQGVVTTVKGDGVFKEVRFDNEVVQDKVARTGYLFYQHELEKLA